MLEHPHTHPQLAVTCRRKQCNALYYVTLPLPTCSHSARSSTYHCPVCATPHTYHREQDHLDYLSLRLSISRKAASTLTECTFLYNSNRSIAHQVTPEAMYTMMDLPTPPHSPTTLTSNGTSPVTIQCLSCGSTAIYQRPPTPVGPSPRTVPSYCCYCGSQHTTVTPNDTEETAWLTLSLHYNIPIKYVKSLYQQWQSYSTRTYFNDYMTTDPEVQLVLKMLSVQATQGVPA